MRRKPTRSENLFEKRLKEGDYDYKSQMILGFYILDFVIPSKMLVFEIDGSIHEEQKKYDRLRDQFIENLGFTVLRVHNSIVTHYPLGEIIRIYDDVETKTFRSALGKANVARSRAIIALRKRGVKI